MAILQQYEQDGLRFGSLQNLYQESLIQENYAYDMIHSYGINIRYYKLNSHYANEFKNLLDSNHLSIHAYGEEFAQSWEDPVKMIAYIKFEQDGIILNSYGVQPESNITMYLNQTDFAISMARKLSRWQEYKVVGDSEFILDFGEVGGGDDTGSNDLINNRDNITINFRTDLFDGTLQAILTDNTLNQILMHDSCSVEENCKLKENPIIVPCKVVSHGKLKIDTGRINPMLYKGDHYDPFEDEMVDAHMHLEIVSIFKDVHGCIRIMGGIRGGVIYHDTEVIGKYLDKVGPEVGDLIDIPVTSDNNIYRQKYEIVHIEQNRANENFMNPFLRNYIYEISLRAYVSSGQVEPNGTSEKQVELQDKLDLINTSAENAAKKIELYEDDWERNIFGGVHKINFRGNPSVQRDANKSTINDFDPPKKTKGLRKSTKPLFIFRDMRMVLSLVDDPKNNVSSLKLSPLKKSTKIDSETNYLEYLRADNDTLVLVNGVQAYLLMSRFKRMELDDGTYCIKPIRLKHEVYAQHNGWADQPFNLVDSDEENELNMDLQDLIGKNTTPEYKPVSENRMTFPWTNTYLYVSYDKVDEDVDNPFEIWTCNVVLTGDETKTPFPICSFILRKK